MLSPPSPPRPLVTFGLRIAACSVAAYVLWLALGAIGLAISAPLFGIALAKPLFELVAELRDTTKRMVFASVEGRHFEHRGHALDIIEDEQHHRWLKVGDVRKIIKSLPRGAVLQRQYPEGVHEDSGLGGHRILAAALLSYLSKSTEPDSLRFKVWLERNVVLPAANLRRRSAIDEVRREDPA